MVILVIQYNLDFFFDAYLANSNLLEALGGRKPCWLWQQDKDVYVGKKNPINN